MEQPSSWKFPGFVQAGMRIDWECGVDRQTMLDYQKDYFGKHAIMVGSLAHEDAWWDDAVTKTLPCISVRLIAKLTLHAAFITSLLHSSGRSKQT